jgi:hypothetical protein
MEFALRLLDIAAAASDPVAVNNVAFYQELAVTQRQKLSQPIRGCSYNIPFLSNDKIQVWTGKQMLPSTSSSFGVSINAPGK